MQKSENLGINPVLRRALNWQKVQQEKQEALRDTIDHFFLVALLILAKMSRQNIIGISPLVGDDKQLDSLQIPVLPQQEQL